MSNLSEKRVIAQVITDEARVAEIGAAIDALVDHHRDEAIFILEAIHQVSRRRLMDALWLPRRRASEARARATSAAQQHVDDAKPFELPVKQAG